MPHVSFHNIHTNTLKQAINQNKTETLTVMHYSDESGLYIVVCCVPCTRTGGMEQLDPPAHGVGTVHSHSVDAAYTVSH